MSATGTWKLSIATPVGEQTPVLILAEDAGTLTGQMTMQGAEPAEVKRGVAQGDELSWTSDVISPITVTLNFVVTVRGDTLDGECRSAIFPSFPVKGRRV
jgi:hypothetical protein